MLSYLDLVYTHQENMFYLGYLTLYLLQTRLDIITAQIQMIPRIGPTEIIYDDSLPEDMLFPKYGDIVRSLHKTTQHPTIHQPKRKSSNRKYGRKNDKRKYGYIPKVTSVRSHLGYIKPEAYEDTYSLAKDSKYKGFLRVVKKRSELRHKLGVVSMVETKTERPEETVNAELKEGDYDDINSEGTVPNFGEPDLTQFYKEYYGTLYTTATENSTNTFYGSLNESDLHDDITEKNILDFYGAFNETDLHDVTTAPTTATTDTDNELSRIPQTTTITTTLRGVNLYALYTITRFITLNKTRGRGSSYMQTRSTYPYESKSSVNLDSIKNYKEALAKIYGDHVGTKSTTLKTFPTKESQLDQYLKFGAFDVLHRSILDINSQGAQTYESVFKQDVTGNNNRVNGNRKPFMDKTIKRSFGPLINIPSLTEVDEVADKLATPIDKFKVPLKIATDKASINVDYDYYHPSTTDKVIQAANKAAGNLFNDLYPGLTETDNKMVKESIENAAFPQDIARLRASTVEKIGNIGVTKSDLVPPWIKSVTTPNGISYMTSKQMNGVTNAFATAIDRFKAPLSKLASMKASFFNENHLPKKEREILAINKAEGNVFNPYSTEKANANINNAIAPGSKKSYLRTPMEEKIDSIDDTELVPPWIKTASSMPKRASHAKYLPKRQMSTASIEPWKLTKVFTVPTTDSPQMLPSTLVYEYKELMPNEVLRIRPETKRSEKMAARSEPSQTQVADRFEPKFEYSVAMGINEENDPFSIFFKKLMKILASKSLQDLRELIKSFNRYVMKLLDSGMLMKLGMTTSSYIAEATMMLHAPIKEIQRQISITQISLDNRRVMLDDDINAMLDEMDDAYDVGEEEAMQRVLHETRVFPNGTKSGEQIVQGFIDDVLLQPMKRIAGTSHGNVVFEYIAKVAKKNTVPLDKNGRRSENFDSLLLTELKETRRFSSGEIKFINPIYDKKDLRYTKVNKDKEIHIRSNIANSQDEDSSKDNKVEIKIQINNIKQSKTSNKRKFRNIESVIDRDFRRNARIKTHSKNSKSKERLKLESFKAKSDERSNVNSKNFNNETEVKLHFDCEPLPVIISKNSLTKQNATEVIMYCSNASNASITIPKLNRNGK